MLNYIPWAMTIKWLKRLIYIIDIWPNCVLKDQYRKLSDCFNFYMIFLFYIAIMSFNSTCMSMCVCVFATFMILTSYSQIITIYLFFYFFYFCPNSTTLILNFSSILSMFSQNTCPGVTDVSHVMSLLVRVGLELVWLSHTRSSVLRLMEYKSF